MESMRSCCEVVCLLGLLAFSFVAPASNGTIVIYWGTYEKEGSLKDACATGNYGIVVLSFLSVFGAGRTPKLDLADHCRGPNNSTNCAPVGEDVKFCQSKGIKVFLSLGGADGNYSITSDSDAASVADYLWKNFLGGEQTTCDSSCSGNDSSKPLGDVVLDGIDFDMEKSPSRSLYYSRLAGQIKVRSPKVLLSAAPQCPFPDEFLGVALATKLFDYVWIQFYNNPGCHYLPGKSLDKVVAAWKMWTTKLRVRRAFFGLPASLSAATDKSSTQDGYIPPEVLASQVLPQLKESPLYGGMMLWSYFYDMVQHDGRSRPYSTDIRDIV